VRRRVYAAEIESQRAARGCDYSASVIGMMRTWALSFYNETSKTEFLILQSTRGRNQHVAILLQMHLVYLLLETMTKFAEIETVYPYISSSKKNEAQIQKW
jgi:hypothetical protein